MTMPTPSHPQDGWPTPRLPTNYQSPPGPPSALHLPPNYYNFWYHSISRALSSRPRILVLTMGSTSLAISTRRLLPSALLYGVGSPK